MTTKQVIINPLLCTLGKTWDLQTKKTKTTKQKQSLEVSVHSYYSGRYSVLSSDVTTTK